ncbi:E3 ubiquitin-protein ligase ORTHRUS 2-like isoform X2 [Papaver somniferum]|uniref:E3 ubiquitin-protein ligase ORTHRUS 2-like isoform X2 n=1 Tax=Papaver somniferum TaxID=3469 RepID=UPI000E700440|nr:E3 ubiquitin-protein ligase ORTHRUS 2-like isoform X2 [Papaver somniferum]
MAQQLPCDGEGVCMSCKTKVVSGTETICCKTCGSSWHASCLSKPIESLVLTLEWVCPDCCCLNDDNNDGAVVSNDILLSSSIGESSSHNKNDLIRLMRAIEADSTLNDQQKAKKRQELMTGKTSDDDDKKKKKTTGGNDVMDILGDNLICLVCRELPERPVTTPCGHNFCLKCFEKWAQGNKICPNRCRPLPQSMINNPRINSALVVAIRTTKVAQKKGLRKNAETVYESVNNQNKPDKAYITERAKRSGKANACSGKIFVTVPNDHFGPILAENDPERNQGVLVGESWGDRFECRQWGAHFPHVAGIAGQSKHGSQSIVLSGGYADDEDHGEWFLYTGRNLSGNKRTNTDQSFDQEFKKLNEALRVSCRKGYPVRVVRSHKEKRSPYAPETGLRYDGIYRIEKWWRKVGIQGFKMCRYLFVRCDNEPAPWTSDEHGDRPRSLPVIKELNGATNVTDRTDSPSWDYDDEESCWKWKKPPPSSKTPVQTGNPGKEGKGARNASLRDKVLKEFKCQLCRQVMSDPLTTPCAHNYCKHCLEAFFVGQSSVRKRSYQGRTLRAQKTIMKCPLCTTDLSEFLENPQVNRELMEVIKNLQRETEDENDKDLNGETNGRINWKTSPKLLKMTILTRLKKPLKLRGELSRLTSA